MTSVAVIGAGITGATTAYALWERGFDVTIIERERYAGMVTSFANGGQLSASNAEVWNNLGTIQKGLGMIFRKDAPLALNPTPSLHKYRWFYEFFKEIKNHDENTRATTRLALDARAHLLRMAEQEDINFDCVKKGILHVYSTEKEFEAAQTGNTLMTEAGLKRTAVTPEEIRFIEPALQGEFYAGLYTPDDFTGDIHKYTRGLIAALLRKGVTIKYNHQVTGLSAQNTQIHMALQTTDGAPVDPQIFDKVVICAGVNSKHLSDLIDDPVNVYPVKGYSITVNFHNEHIDRAPWVSLLDEKAKIVTSRLGNNRFRVAGTAEFNGYNKDIREDRVKPLIQWTEKHFPDLPTDDVTPWAGLRPMTPNMMPHVGPGKLPGTYFNTGHGHLGWTLSAITAQMIGDIIQSPPQD